MTGSKPPPPGAQTPPEPEEPDEKKSGRVTFDSRGNAVWEWSMSTGIFGRNVDTKRLKKLEAADLRIEDEPNKAAPELSFEQPRPVGGGGDPYNSSGAGLTGGRSKRTAQKPKDLRRLSEWIQQQKSIGKKTDEE